MAYNKKIPVDLDCPLMLTLSLIDSKWESCLLDELAMETECILANFTDLCRKRLREYSTCNVKRW